MNLTEFAKEVHENAVTHGWWDDKPSFGDVIALCHSELSEALEEYRKGHPLEWFECYDCYAENALEGIITICGSEETSECAQKNALHCDYRSKKPEGIAVELADCILRILDYCGKAEIDIEDIITRKHEYNKTRPYRHGGKVL